jgi:excisionase family DNA binding protein
MNLITEPEIETVSLSDSAFTIAFHDGRILSVPYKWFPRLLLAAPEERAQWSVTGGSISWDALDEDISSEALLAGKPDSSAFARRYWEENPGDDPRPRLRVGSELELSIAEAARRINVSRQRLAVLVKQGRIPARKFGKQYLIRAVDLNGIAERKAGRPKNVHLAG